MDEEALLTKSANPVEDAERPLVTFALFAYNQEHYVREAIEGAFAQTYSPLEIILSDDCSTDGTFAIMQEMAAAYTGPHRVVARQSPQNRRVLRHVLDVARLAQGKYMIVAAGDDISLPQRTEKLVEVFEREGADFCWSAYENLDENSENVFSFQEDFHRTTNIFNLRINRIPGATAAYKISNIHKIPKINQPIFYEDNFFEIFAIVNHLKVSFSAERLVNYRVLANSLSMRFSRDAETFETNLTTHYGRIGDTAILAIETFCDGEALEQRPELARFRDFATFYKAVSAWRGMRVLERIGLLLQAPDRKALKWFLPRAVLGWHLFVLLKGWQLNYR